MRGSWEPIGEVIDWDEVRRRILEDSDEEREPAELPGEESLSLDLLFDDMAPPSAGEKEARKRDAILRARAHALAQPPQEEMDEGIPLVVFSLSGEKYALPTANVQEVQPLQQVCEVPCTPAFVVGVVNIRGAIYSVIDIREFLGIPGRGVAAGAKVIMVKAAGLEVGILADDVLGAISAPVSKIKPPPVARSRVREEYIRGVTEEMIVILNLEALLSDERIIVHEEVA